MIGVALSAPGTALRTRRRRSRASPARASSDAARSAHGGREPDSAGNGTAAGCATALTAGSALFSRTKRAAGSEVVDRPSEDRRSTVVPARAARLARRGRCCLADGFTSRAAAARARARERTTRGEGAVSPTGAAALRVARARSGAVRAGAALGGASTAAGACTAGAAASGEAGWTTGSGARGGAAAGAGVDSRGGSSVSGST